MSSKTRERRNQDGSLLEIPSRIKAQGQRSRFYIILLLMDDISGFFPRVSNDAHVTLHLAYAGGLAVTLGQIRDVWGHSCRQDPRRITVNTLLWDLLRSNVFVFSNSAYRLIQPHSRCSKTKKKRIIH